MRTIALGRIPLVALVGLLVGLSACSSAASPGPGLGGLPRDLDGTSWRAIAVRDVTPVAGAEPTIRFEGGQAGGTTGCNTYGGAYALRGDGAFTFGAMVMTEMACSDERGVQESVIVEVLSNADRLEFLADGTIRISGPLGAAVFAEDPR